MIKITPLFMHKFKFYHPNMGVTLDFLQVLLAWGKYLCMCNPLALQRHYSWTGRLGGIRSIVHKERIKIKLVCCESGAATIH